MMEDRDQCISRVAIVGKDIQDPAHSVQSWVCAWKGTGIYLVHAAVGGPLWHHRGLQSVGHVPSSSPDRANELAPLRLRKQTVPPEYPSMFAVWDEQGLSNPEG